MTHGAAVAPGDQSPGSAKTASSESSNRPPLHLAFWAWMRERFPPSHAVLFVVLYLTAALTAQAMVRPGPVIVRLSDASSCAAAYAFFLMLRIFDEHKDYAVDAVNHPDRALQRGWITLAHLRVLGAIAILVQLLVSLVSDDGWGPVTQWWLIALGWSLLMAREFFAADWLRSRLLLYAASHMLVMPLVMMWMAQMGVGRTALPLSIGWLAALSFTSGFAFEVARKTKAPADERDGVDSYSAIAGPRRAALLTSLFVGLSGALATRVTLAVADGMPAWLAIGVIVLVALLVIGQLVTFGSHPSPAGAKRCEKVVSVALLASHAAIIGAIVAERGLRW